VQALIAPLAEADAYLPVVPRILLLFRYLKIGNIRIVTFISKENDIEVGTIDDCHREPAH
jgi:hypothetical protein